MRKRLNTIWDSLERYSSLIGKPCRVMGAFDIVLDRIVIEDDDVYFVGTDDVYYSAVGGCEEIVEDG